MRLLSFALALAFFFVPARPARADDETDRSRAAFKAGAHAFDQGHAEDALGLFKEAYRLHPSYVTWYNIGLCESAVGHPVEASDAFRAYLHGGGAQIPHEKAEAVGKLADESEARVGHLAIVVNQSAARVTVDDKPVTDIGGVRVDPGTHAVVASADGFGTERARIAVERGGSASVRLDLAPLDADAAPRPTPIAPLANRPRFDALFFGVAGVSAGAFIAGGIMGGVALHDYHVYKDPNVGEAVAARAKSQGEVLKLTTDFAFVLGIATGITAALLATKRKPAEPPRATVTFDVGPSRGGLGVAGRF